MNDVAEHQLAAATRFNLTVDCHIPALNHELGLPAGPGQTAPFEKLIQAERIWGFVHSKTQAGRVTSSRSC